MSLLLEALKKAAQEKQAQQRSADDAVGTPQPRAQAGDPRADGLSLEPVDPRETLDEPDRETSSAVGPGGGTDPDLQLEPQGADPSAHGPATPYERPATIEPPDARKGAKLPRMQGPEPAAALSPEAARRVFDSKRQGSTPRTRLFVLGGFGVVVLMAVLLSLFYYSSQVSQLDEQLATFRREPRAMAPPPPRPVSPAETPDDAPARSEARVERTDPGDASARDSATGAPIIDQVEEGVVAAAAPEDDPRSGNEDSGARPATVSSDTSPGADTSPIISVAPRPGGSMRVTSRAQDARPTSTERVSRDEIVIRSESRIPDADRLLMEAYEAYRRGDLERAERAYGSVLRSRPDDRDALLGLAAIQQRRGSSAGAVAIYRRLLELNPKDSVARSAMLELSSAQGGVRESDLKVLLRDQPDAPHLHFALGNLYAAEGRWSQAQGAYFDAHRLSPDNADYAFNLAVSLDRLDKPQVARRYYEQALAAVRGGAPASFSTEGVQRRLNAIDAAPAEP